MSQHVVGKFSNYVYLLVGHDSNQTTMAVTNTTCFDTCHTQPCIQATRAVGDNNNDSYFNRSSNEFIFLECVKHVSCRFNFTHCFVARRQMPSCYSQSSHSHTIEVNNSLTTNEEIYNSVKVLPCMLLQQLFTERTCNKNKKILLNSILYSLCTLYGHFQLYSILCKNRIHKKWCV